MKRRTRFAGIILLVATSLSLAQSAWASVCAGQMMHAGESEAAMEMPGMPPMADMPADEDCAGGHTHGDEGSAPHQEDCPFAPAALGNGCTAAASLPAPSIVALSAHDVDVSTANNPIAKPHSASSAAPFHPPKA